jgi:hypothetical protein
MDNLFFTPPPPLKNKRNVTVLDRNQAEQGGTGGSDPQLLGSGLQFITRISSYSQLFSSWPTITNHAVAYIWIFKIALILLSGGPEVQTLLSSDATCNVIVRYGCWFWSCQALYCSCPPDNLPSFPMSKGCYQWSNWCYPQETWGRRQYIW